MVPREVSISTTGCGSLSVMHAPLAEESVLVSMDGRWSESYDAWRRSLARSWVATVREFAGSRARPSRSMHTEGWRSRLSVTRNERDFDAARDMPGLNLARARRYTRVRLAAMATGAGWLAARSALFAFSGASSRLGRFAKRIAPNPAAADVLYLG